MSKEELLKVAKPILFNTAMVKAILEGRKTVTRRVINRDIVNRCDMERDGTLLCFEDAYGDHIRPEKLCRYKPGDILYVRETWCKGMIDSGEYPDGRSEWFISQCEGENDLILKAHAIHEGIDIEDVKWKPSIHMPKEAARIFLKVKNVRVERLQDMSEDDAFAEGVSPWDDRCYARNEWKPTFYDPDSGGPCRPLDAFEDIWNSTIDKKQVDTYGWDANPYVWVIEFEKIDLNKECD